MTLKNAVWLAVLGMALWTVLLLARFVTVLSGVMRGLVPSNTLISVFVQLFAVVTLLIFFVVFGRAK